MTVSDEIVVFRAPSHGDQFAALATLRRELTGLTRVLIVDLDRCAASFAGALEGFTEPDLVSIAAVSGTLGAGALGLALACDILIMAPDAVLTIDPPGGAPIPERLAGYPQATSWVLTGAALGAAEAIAAGLASQIAADPVAVARELAEQICAYDRDEVIERKALLRRLRRARTSLPPAN